MKALDSVAKLRFEPLLTFSQEDGCINMKLTRGHEESPEVHLSCFHLEVYLRHNPSLQLPRVA